MAIFNENKLMDGVENYFYYKRVENNKTEESKLLKRLDIKSVMNDVKSISYPEKRERYDNYTDTHPFEKDKICQSIQNGIDENEKRKLNHTRTNFQAEKFYSRYFLVDSISNSILGKFVDYEVPLKPNGLCGGLGEIDLLSINEDIKEAYIIEVKRPDNKEMPLRAILEVYTYWKLVGGDDSNHFLETSKVKGAKKLNKCVLVYYNDKRSIYQYFKEQWNSYYKKIMNELGIKLFIALTSKEERKVEDFYTKKIVEVKESFEEAEEEILCPISPEN